MTAFIPPFIPPFHPGFNRASSPRSAPHSPPALTHPPYPPALGAPSGRAPTHPMEDRFHAL